MIQPKKRVQRARVERTTRGRSARARAALATRTLATTRARAIACVLACVLVALGICLVVPAGNATALEGVDRIPELVLGQAPADAEPTDEVQQAVEDAVPKVEDYELQPDVEYDPNVVLVCVDKGADEADVARALEAQGVESVDAGSVTMLSDTVALLELAPGATVEEAIGELSASGAVNAACPDVVLYTADDAVEMSAEAEDKADGAEPLSAEDEPTTAETSLSATPDEPAAALDQELATPDQELATQATASGNTTDPYATYQWALQSMDVSDALLLANQTGARDRSVGVAIIDSAFQTDHPDLVANQAVVYDAFLEAENPAPREDEQGETGHGTHVAGIVGAVADNGRGVAGVSGNKARLVLVRTSNDEGSVKVSLVVKAYTYLIEHREEYGIRIANLSIGLKWGTINNGMQTLLNTIESAYRDYGIVTVAAAGNSNLGTVPYRCYPSDINVIVSVINLTSAASSVSNSYANIVNKNNVSKKANYLYTVSDATSVSKHYTSNYNVAGGKGANVSAPGTSILSTVASDAGDELYAYNTGTSMASPQVAGVLALMFAANPSLSAPDAKSALYMSARDIGEAGWDEEYGYGEVNARDAVQAAMDGVVQGPDFLGIGQVATYSVPDRMGQAIATSTDVGVLEVDEHGNAQARAVGIARVVMTADDVSASREVCVVGPIEGDAYVAKDGSTQLAVTQPSAAGALGWKWSSADKSVATVTNDGVVHGQGVGRVTITATLAVDPNVSFSQEMRVYRPLLEEESLACGHAAQLVLGDDLLDGEPESYVWTSADEAIATVNDAGYVTGVARGTTTLTWKGTYAGNDDPVVYVFPLHVYGPLYGADEVYEQGTTTLTVADARGSLTSGWTWTSSNASVATVQGGVVTGVGAGTATIRARRGDVWFDKTVRVKALTKVRAPSSASYTYAGKGIWCNLEGTGYRLSGTVHAKDVGTYYVTAWLQDGYVWSDGTSGSKRISWAITRAKLTATYVSQTIVEGGAAAGSVKVTGFVGYDKASTAEGYKAPTVSISAAQRNKVGTYTIKPAGGAARNYTFAYVAGTLTVKAAEVPDPPTPPDPTPDPPKPAVVDVTGLKLNKKTLALRPAQTARLIATVSPSNASDKTVRWTSSNTKVAKVSSAGKVTAVGVGTATITAKAGKRTASCKVTVRLPAAHVAYRSHVQGIGWQGSVLDGKTSGTTGKGRRLEAVRMSLRSAPYAGAIEYSCHVQGIGWQKWVRNGALGGTTGAGRRLEAVRIRLTGTMARYYDVSYRVHVQGIGWTAWRKNGALAGTVGQGRRLEAIQVRLNVKRG